jgi:hypothetical protein
VTALRIYVIAWLAVLCMRMGADLVLDGMRPGRDVAEMTATFAVATAPLIYAAIRWAWRKP